MEGESLEAIWMANRKSILEIKEEMKNEDEEGKNCTDLITLLRNNFSPDFCSESCARLQICHHTILEVQGDLDVDVDVESELNVGKHFWKITVSIIAVIIKLSTYSKDQSNAKNLVSSVMKACSQAWTIMNVIEVSDGEAVEVSEAANNLFHSLEKERKWLGWCLPVSTPTCERTLTEAKKAMQSLIEKGKEKAMNDPYENGKKKGKNRKKKTDTRKWSERVAGYNMYKLGLHVNHQFPNVEAILNKLKGMLADGIGSCMVKVVGVIMEDFKKQESLYAGNSNSSPGRSTPSCPTAFLDNANYFEV